MKTENGKLKKEQQRITQITLIITKKVTPFYKKNAVNSFVKFVQFVVKKWVVGRKTNKKSVFSVVKYSGVSLCGFCGSYAFCFFIFDILFPKNMQVYGLNVNLSTIE